MTPVSQIRARTLLGVTLTSVAWAGRAVAAPRDPVDQELVARTRERAPEVVALLEKGEAQAAAGSLEDAVATFRHGAAVDPYSAGIFQRRECEALTSLNRRVEAIAACQEALQSFRTPSAVRATVRSLVAGPTAPSFGELAQALRLLSTERERSPKNPQLAAAACDVAESLGDGNMLQRCAEELELIAPDYGPTRGAELALARTCPPWRFWTGWISVAVAAIVTGIDALRRAMRSRAGRGPQRALAAILVILAMSFSGAARAEGKWLSQWPIDDKNPESSIPPAADLKANALQAGYFLQDLISKAALASKAGDHAGAIRFYQAMLKMVPDRSISLTRMCTEFEAMGDLNGAVNSCGLALALDGVTGDDYAHFVHLLLRKETTLTDKDVGALTNVINHVKADPNGAVLGNELQCEVALRTKDVDKLSECTAALVAAAPKDSATILYEWNLALARHDYAQASQLVVAAKAAGIKGDALNHMERATNEAKGNRHWMLGLFLLGGLILLVTLVYGLLSLGRRGRTEPEQPATA
jgi:tetratricopeptide (TPR) repeat protein